MTENIVSSLYIISSVITILAFLGFHSILNILGNYKATLIFISTQILLLLGLIYGNSPYLLGFVFVISLVVNSLLSLNLDIFLENETATKETGSIRGIFLTAVNASWVIAPLLAGALLDGETNYRLVYAGSLILILPFAYMIRKNFKNFVDVRYSHATLKATAHKVFHSVDLKKIFCANIILQSFYAWMVIYTPVYLNKYVGFGWDDIGIIFTVMLLPFILVDYPLGKLADKKYGEKEIMSIGFLILGGATICLSFIQGPNFFLWTTALFATRVGAATVEMMIETYFFKKVPEKDLNILELFRITRPVSYIVAPILATVGFYFIDHQSMFTIIGILCLFGLYFSLTIKDTN